jgi:ribosomal protein S18 acetylase RimI-like enzyme
MDRATLRHASPDDAALLAALGARTFTETFGHLYPSEDLAAFLKHSYSTQRLADYLADPPAAAWILELEGEAIGYALVGACDLPHSEVTAACGELKRLYVLADHRGGGRGGRLLDAALSHLEARGQRPIWIGVWSENFGAQKLYGRLGFEKVGEYEFPVGGTRDREFILRRG